MDQAAGLRDMVKENGQGLCADNDESKDSNSRVRVISITSGKGGVGKTSVTANLACVFQSLGKRVLIMDADLGLSNMDIVLGLNPRYTIGHLLKGEKTLDEVIVTAQDGVKLLPAASGIQELTDLDNSQKLFLLNELDALNSRFDILLIDTGAGISSNVMYFNYAAMERIVVITDEPTSLTDAYALIKILNSEYHQKRFKVLVNSVPNGNEAEKIFRSLSVVADKYLDSPSLDYLGWIPYDKMIPKTVRKQKPLLNMNLDTPASKNFKILANNILASENEPSFEGDIKFFWRSLLDC